MGKERLNRTIRGYYNRRKMRLNSRGIHYDSSDIRFDASARLAYGIAKSMGIDTTGMSPKEVWAAIDKNGGGEDREKKQLHKTNSSNEFGRAHPKEFIAALGKAQKSMPSEKGWRVSVPSVDEFIEEHPDSKCHINNDGSTVAVTKEGDIISVCTFKGGNMSGAMLLEQAIANGGKKLDSYAGNHLFYVKNGFVPVSWVEWNHDYDDYAKANGWDPERDAAEPVIFYKYVGKEESSKCSMDYAEALKSIKPSESYDEAREKRDSEIK